MPYQSIDTIIANIEPSVSAAEAHGMATGMLCIDGRTNSIDWIKEVFQDATALLEEEKNILLALFEQTQGLLNSEEFSFDLFIPGDDFTLQEQAEGLKNWCKGFLLGVGYSTSDANWPGETEEILKDIVEFSKVDDDIEDDDEANENALMEIHEYLRAAVLLFQAEFLDENEDKPIFH